MKSEACFLPRNYLFEFDTEIWLPTTTQEDQFRFNKLRNYLFEFDTEIWLLQEDQFRFNKLKLSQSPV